MEFVDANATAVLFASVFAFVAGCLMFRYRREIGGATDYRVATGKYVDRPTPGWMIVPFAIALAVLGVAGIFLSVRAMISG